MKSAFAELQSRTLRSQLIVLRWRAVARRSCCWRSLVNETRGTPSTQLRQASRAHHVSTIASNQKQWTLHGYVLEKDLFERSRGIPRRYLRDTAVTEHSTQSDTGRHAQGDLQTHTGGNRTLDAFNQFSLL